MFTELEKIKRVVISNSGKASIIAVVFVILIATAIFTGFNIQTNAALNSCAEGWKVDAGSYRDINCHSTCARVSVSGGSSVFVPTASSGEWTAFRSNPPSSVSLSACGGGGSCTVGAVCWTVYYHHNYNICGGGISFVYNLPACTVANSSETTPGKDCEHTHTYKYNSSCNCVYSYDANPSAEVFGEELFCVF
ncbi:MAG: hypothetical protein WD712_02755 [Candidatus Spechtbacterales bacterium]